MLCKICDNCKLYCPNRLENLVKTDVKKYKLRMFSTLQSIHSHNENFLITLNNLRDHFLSSESLMFSQACVLCVS